MEQNMYQTQQFLEQETELELVSFTNEEALRLGLLIVSLAKERGKSVAVRIERNREPLFFHLMEGTGLDHLAWCIRKKNVVDRFGHSSLYVRNRYLSRGTTFEERTRLDPQKYRAAGGSFPLAIKKVGVVGSVTVSGMTDEEDHELCVMGIRSMLDSNLERTGKE